jgi:hypothetical protein
MQQSPLGALELAEYHPLPTQASIQPLQRPRYPKKSELNMTGYAPALWRCLTKIKDQTLLQPRN